MRISTRLGNNVRSYYAHASATTFNHRDASAEWHTKKSHSPTTQPADTLPRRNFEKIFVEGWHFPPSAVYISRKKKFFLRDYSFCWVAAWMEDWITEKQQCCHQPVRRLCHNFYKTWWQKSGFLNSKLCVLDLKSANSTWWHTRSRSALKYL